jgi:hypothetical protein
MTIVDVIGSAGVLLLLIAYFLHSTGYLEGDGLPYIVMNIAGAGLACLASILLKYMPFVILEAAWTGVSIFALIKYIKAGTKV